MKYEIHVMLDLETLGNRLNPVIVQIAAVAFDFHGYIGCSTEERFNVLVADATCADAGLSYTQSTLDWWKEQSQEAQDKVFNPEGRVSIQEALIQFTCWINKLREKYGKVYLHGNGIRADNVWLLSAYKACNMDDPVAYNEDLDYRTLHYLSMQKAGYNIKDTVEFEGIPHNAIDDCIYQIKCAQKMYEVLMQ